MKKKGPHLKSSPKLRPRRRASQTYFFKYQLARNPLKAEEEDLKQALIASLQNCEHDDEQQQQKTKHPPPKQPALTTAPQPTPPQPQPPPPPPPTIKETVYDEEYLKRYRPETEDFLTFICFRVTAPNFPTSKGINVKIGNDNPSRRSTSPYKSSGSNHTASNNVSARFTQAKNCDLPGEDRLSKPRTHISSPNDLYSPSNRRRPTRQSPRLASSSRKISEIDSLNHYTANDNQITYEEDIKRAQIALEDMAQEINDPEVYEPIAQSGHRQSNSQQQQHVSSKTIANGGSVTSNGKSLSSFKNNKHLVKGLMTREFAGAFADEEIIFESIKNHKL